MNLGQIVGAARRLGRALAPLIEQRGQGPRGTVRSDAPSTRPRSRTAPAATDHCEASDELQRDYPGDFTGVAQLEYSPRADGKPDPGEIVWTWVPFEEDHCQGKDRPVLLVGRNGAYLLAAMLTTRDRNNAREHDPHYLDISSGAWDPKGRPSEVKLNRILQVNPADVRRNGAVLDEGRFRTVQDRLEQLHGWTR